MKPVVRHDGEDHNKQHLNIQALKNHAVQLRAVFSSSMRIESS
jgi:hypothetical protein